MLKTRQEKRSALLKARIELACDEAAAFIDAQAAELKAHDGFNQPINAIRDLLTKGQCPCRAALRLINGDA